MKQNERIQWLHKKITDNSYPNAQRLADNFDISLTQAKRDVGFLKNSLKAPLRYDATKKGYMYESPYSLPVYNSSSNDEEFNGILSSVETDLKESAELPVIQVQLPYSALIEVSDKLAVLELRPFIVRRTAKDTYLCDFHSVEVFLAAILALEADIKLKEPEWLRLRLVDSANRVIRNNSAPLDK